LIKGSSIDYGMAESRSNLKIVIVVSVVAILVLMMMWVVLAYNSTVSKEQEVNSSESQIKNSYTTKITTMADLAPILESYQEYEGSLLTNITELSTRWMTALDDGANEQTLGNMTDQIDTNATSFDALLIVTYNNYPDLQLVSLVSQYMGEVTDLNLQLQYSREQYNDAVQSYNSSIKSFPMMLFASSFGFDERDYWGSERPGDGSNL